VNIDIVWLTRSYPKLSIFIRRARALATGRPYFFNRQRLRVRTFLEINSRIEFDNFVETGTYLGMTTRFFSETARAHGARVYSCELNEGYFSIATRVLRDLTNVHLHRGDSAEFIRWLSDKISDAVNFVYLDAHWYNYLPLQDELSVVLSWKNTVVMIDDFRVPFDDDFGWDKYDEVREISMKYIEGSIGNKPVYFPSYPAHKEGVRIARGYCLIPTSERMSRVLDGIELLREFNNLSGCEAKIERRR
jgi:predicted O-methyltransferase YrrM